MNYDKLQTATITLLDGDHDIYRSWEIPGLRDSDYYDGTGIIKTYNLADTDRRYPPDENAVPSLVRVKSGNIESKIFRKKHETKVLVCPECDAEGKKTHGGENICPECGLILSKTDAKDVDHHEEGVQLSRTANAAGRFAND